MTVGQQSQGVLRDFPPHLLGARSPIPYVQAIGIAEAGYPCFPSTGDRWLRGSKDLATTDLKTLRSWHDGLETDWRVRTEIRDGLTCLKFSSARQLEWLTRDFGSLPRTWTVERLGGHAYLLFQRGILDPEFALEQSIRGSQVKIQRSCPLPGSRHVSGEIWAWKSTCAPGESNLANLPKNWVAGLPRRLIGITANVVKKHEWQPGTPN